MSINNRIDKIITTENLTNKGLADVLGVTEATVRNFRKKGVVKEIYLEKIANHYNYNFDWLVSGLGEMKLNGSRNSNDYGKFETRFKDFTDAELIAELINREETIADYPIYKLFIENEVRKKLYKIETDNPQIKQEIINLITNKL